MSNSQSPWLRRLTLSLAAVLFITSSLLCVAWFLNWEFLLQPSYDLAPIEPESALAFVFLGLALLGTILGSERSTWLALLPGLIGGIAFLGPWVSPGWSLDGNVLRLQLRENGVSAGDMPKIVGFCLLLGAAALLSRRLRSLRRYHSVMLAAAGSVLAAVGFSTVVGYAFSMPVVYRWGSGVTVAHSSAVLLLVFGVALLTSAWQEHGLVRPGAPMWLPMPVVIGSATLTLILWLGLRETETITLGTHTQVTLRSYAAAIGRELERQNSGLERLANRWATLEEPAREDFLLADARALRAELPALATIALVDADLRTLWTESSGASEVTKGFSHATDPVRRSAATQARERRRTQMSGSIHQAGSPARGFAVYVPLLDGEAVRGFVSAEFPYRRFFGALERNLKITGNYHAAVFIGPEQVYEGGEPALDGGAHKVEEVFDVSDRRVRIELAPSARYLAGNRRYLPELALGAGCGITLLLGLSVHLARAARSGLRAAEMANRKLVQENEERRVIEERLVVSDERLRLALDSTQIGIYEWNLRSGELYYSPGVWTMLGYQPGVIPATQEAWASLVHPEDLPAFRSAMDKQLRGELTFIDPEYRVLTATREWRWLYVRARTVESSKAGAPLRIIGTLQDVTARKSAERALRVSQATTRKLSLVASRTDNLVIICAPDGRIEWVNDSFERVMEYTLAEVVGTHPGTIMIGPETSTRTVRRIQAAMRRGRGITTDVVNYSKSGKKYHLHLEIQPVRNEAGVLENFIAIQADITSRVETENNLRRAKGEADAASRAKSEFLASMSHEIRTPMNGVIGMTSLLLDTHLSHDQRDFVNTIRTSGDALLTIINDILDFSKIESGKMELEHLPFELSVCIEDALDLFSVQAAAKKLELTYHVDDSVPAWIQGDVTRLRQVLVNLVNNAVKFTPAGSIAVTISRLAAPANTFGENSAVLEFTVADTGIGIPNDRLDRLFRPFSQVDSSTTRKYGGTGLGLAICHRLCALMGGSIGVQSTVGLGSKFSFTILAEAVHTPPGWGFPELPVRLNYGEVLCIDDHPVSQSRLQTFFTAWGARAVCAASAEAALEYLSGDYPPLAILLDYELTETPVGHTLRDRIRDSDIPTLLLLPTGNNAHQLETFTGRRGVTTASKPLRTHALVRGMQTLFDNPPDSLPPFAVSNEMRLLAHDLPLDVLLVEDNPVNQKVALRFLDRLGYRADAVANGLEAVNTLQSRHYHLVLMDLQMPEMDGFEATRELRRRLPADRQPKVIALTANALHGDREQCLAAGMDDYITKPVKLLDIAQAIRRQFSVGSRSPLNRVN